MFSNYFKIAWRNLFANKLHSSINITGLALGMAAATLLLLNIQHGLSIDQFHEKKANLYQAYTKGIINGELSCDGSTADPLAPALKSYSEIRNVASVDYNGQLLRYADKKLTTGGMVADADFLCIFKFPLVQRHRLTAPGNPHRTVIALPPASQG